MDKRDLEVLSFNKIIDLLVSFASSNLGKQKALQIKPFSDLSSAIEAQKETADALSVLIRRGAPSLAGFSEISSALRRAQSGARLSIQECLSISAFLRASARLQSFAALPSVLSDDHIGLLSLSRESLEEEAKANRFYNYCSSLHTFPLLERELTQGILNEEALSDAASPKLSAIRQSKRQQVEHLKRSLEKILQDSSQALQEAFVTQRNDRYVIPVKAEYKSQVQGLVHDVSSSGATLFIEPMLVVEQNNKIKELEHEEFEEVSRILMLWSEEIAQIADLLLENVTLAASLDFALAKARLADSMNAVMPELNDEGHIDLRQARHPFIDKKKVVPININLGLSYKLLLITGPNTGGKTVSLKTCGLLSLMGMAGLHIPAAIGSRLSIFDSVWVDIGDDQSIEQNLSTFSAHIKNLARIIDQATEKSLVLLDELGSGTDPMEGAALAHAILDFFRNKNLCLMASTHYKELKAYASETDGVMNASCEFDLDSLQPTYRLILGMPGLSNAFHIAEKLGFNSQIIEDAKERLPKESLAFENLIAEAQERAHRTSVLEEQVESLKKELEQEKEALAFQRQQLKEKKKSILAQSRESRRQFLAEKIQETESMMKEIRKAIDEKSYDEANYYAETFRQELKADLNRVEHSIAKETLKSNRSERKQPKKKEIKVGETYYIASLKALGKVCSEPDKKGEVAVTVGALSLRVPITSIFLSSENERKKLEDDQLMGTANFSRKIKKQALQNQSKSSSKRSQVALGYKKAANFSPELMLIGKRSEEALLLLDRFIDDAVLISYSKLRIVHGKGSGLLRRAIHKFLAKDSRVKHFELAPYGEGDSGVTLIDL